MIKRGQDPTEADKLYKLEKELIGIQATVAKTMEDVFFFFFLQFILSNFLSFSA